MAGKNRDFIMLPYTTKEIINRDLHLNASELDEALAELQKLGLISIDKDGKIFDTQTNFEKLCAHYV